MLFRSEDFPVITANFWADASEEGIAFHNWKDGEADEDEQSLLDQYRMLQYNDLNDPKNRVWEFFGS